MKTRDGIEVSEEVDALNKIIRVFDAMTCYQYEKVTRLDRLIKIARDRQYHHTANAMHASVMAVYHNLGATAATPEGGSSVPTNGTTAAAPSEL